MDKTIAHTPTPWHRNISPAWKHPIYADKNGDPNGKNWIHIGSVLPGNPNAEADLDFIVQAVNAHEELLYALNKILNNAQARKWNGESEGPDFDAFSDIEKEARQAIAKAEVA